MKSFRTHRMLFLYTVFFFFCSTGFAGSKHTGPVAFPGAEGFGRYATGGRGGEVFWVTTLEDSDEKGTLRYAVAQKGPRTILFNVAGTIFLKKDLRITQDDVTIAGESAPGQGICIAGYPVKLNADNVILRYLRFRVGDRGEGEPDGLMGTGGKNIIIDHCSISWSVDESCSIYGNEDTTVQWCMITESLRTAGHSKGKHGMVPSGEVPGLHFITTCWHTTKAGYPAWARMLQPSSMNLWICGTMSSITGQAGDATAVKECM